MKSKYESKRAKKPIVPAVTSEQFTVSTAPADLRSSLGLLAIPARIIDLILDTQYKLPNGQMIPIFGLARSAENPAVWKYRDQEIQEIIGVYDSFKGIHVATGEPNSPVKYYPDSVHGPVIDDDDETYIKMRDHINSLVLNRQRKTANKTLVYDDSTYEAPELRYLRDDETLRTTLLNRKKVPVANLPCRACKAMEVRREELYTRSGDEPAVEHFVCGRCNVSWKS